MASMRSISLVLLGLALAWGAGAAVARAGTLPPLTPENPYSCTAHAAIYWLAATTGLPYDALPGQDALYRAAQLRDGWPLPHHGTYVQSVWAVLADWGWVLPGSARYGAAVTGPRLVVRADQNHTIYCDGAGTCQDWRRFAYTPRPADLISTATPTHGGP